MILKIIGALFFVAALAAAVLIYVAEMRSDAPGAKVGWGGWAVVIALVAIGAAIFWSK